MLIHNQIMLKHNQDYVNQYHSNKMRIMLLHRDYIFSHN